HERLQRALDAQAPLEAAWWLRDTFECLIKFTASLALADFLRDAPDPKLAERVVKILFKPMALGDWVTVLDESLRPLEPLARAGRLGESGRLLSGLYSLVFLPRGGGHTPWRGGLAGKPASFVPWRNQVFGHGVFRNEPAYYAEETLRWIPPLHQGYQELGTVLDG